MTSAEEHRDRERLAAEIQALNVAFESRALPTLLDPLLAVQLTIQQLKVLTVLVASGEIGSTGRELAATFGVSMASMSGVLDRLVEQGMTVRSGDADDARVRRVRATELGRSVMLRLVASRPEFEDDVLMNIPLEDLQGLVSGMRAIRAELDRRGVSSND